MYKIVIIQFTSKYSRVLCALSFLWLVAGGCVVQSTTDHCWPLLPVLAGLGSCTAVPAQLSHCTAGLVGLGSCGCTGTTVSLHCCAGGTGRTASWSCTAAGGVASGTLSFSCFKTQLLLFHLVFQMLVVTDKKQMILLHSLFQILYIHYLSNWLQVFEKLKCK